MSDDATKVTPARLRRDAYLYIRQSTLYQVINNTESTGAAIRPETAARSRSAGPRTRSTSSTSTRAAPAPAPPTGPGSSTWSPRSPWAGPASCSAWNAPGWPATPPTGSSCCQICAHTDTLICDEDGLYDPAIFNDRAPAGDERPALRIRTPFPARQDARRDPGQGPPRRARARPPGRPGPRPPGPGSAGPRRRRARRRAAAVRHLRRHRLGVRRRQGIPRTAADLPRPAPPRAPRAASCSSSRSPTTGSSASCTTPPTPAPTPTGGPATPPAWTDTTTPPPGPSRSGRS